MAESSDALLPIAGATGGLSNLERVEYVGQDGAGRDGAARDQQDEPRGK